MFCHILFLFILGHKQLWAMHPIFLRRKHFNQIQGKLKSLGVQMPFLKSVHTSISDRAKVSTNHWRLVPSWKNGWAWIRFFTRGRLIKCVGTVWRGSQFYYSSAVHKLPCFLFGFSSFSCFYVNKQLKRKAPLSFSAGFPSFVKDGCRTVLGVKWNWTFQSLLQWICKCG